MSQLSTITQFLFATTNYEKDHDDFREKKDKLFTMEEKCKIKRIEELNQFQSVCESETVNKKKFNTTNYILKINSSAQLNQLTNKRFPSVRVVDLSNAKIAYIPDKFPLIFESLQVLNLQNNLISEMPQFLNNLPLIQLNINNNLLKSISIGFTWMESMERLDIGKNHIRCLPSQLYQMQAISIIDLRSNDFTLLENTIIKLKTKLSALGLDWVKYNFRKCYNTRQDVLVEKDLDQFWLVIEKLKFNEHITCQDFISHYNKLMEKSDEKLLQEDEEENKSQIFNDNQYLQEHSNEQTIIISQIQFRNQTQELETRRLSAYHKEAEILFTEELDQNKQIILTNDNVMHTSVYNEDLGVLRTLIEQDIELANYVDEENHTPLSLAIQEEKYHCAKILLNSQANINLGGGPMGSCLNIAISKMQYFLVRDLLSLKADVSKCDRQGNGPLHYLINLFKRNTMEAIKIGYLLLEAGADPNLMNEQGLTPLHCAIKKSFLTALNFFLQYNTDQNSQCFNIKQNTSDNNNLIHLAAKSENIKIILLVYKLNPFFLFCHNDNYLRPFDLIQKNYTLSKLLQSLEFLYLEQHLQKENISYVHLGNKKPVIQSVSSSFNVNDSEDENSNHIQHGMALMKFETKLKKQNFQSFNQNSGMNIDKIKLKNRDKIPIEKTNIMPVNKTIQQDRNDLKKLEIRHKYKNKSQVSNKSVHYLIQNIQELQCKIKKDYQTDGIYSQIDFVLFKRLVIQLNMMKQNPFNNLLVNQAMELQYFKLDEDIQKLNSQETQNVQEQELLVMNLCLKLQTDNLMVQYESLQY